MDAKIPAVGEVKCPRAAQARDQWCFFCASPTIPRSGCRRCAPPARVEPKRFFCSGARGGRRARFTAVSLGLVGVEVDSGRSLRRLRHSFAPAASSPRSAIAAATRFRCLMPNCVPSPKADSGMLAAGGLCKRWWCWTGSGRAMGPGLIRRHAGAVTPRRPGSNASISRLLVARTWPFPPTSRTRARETGLGRWRAAKGGSGRSFAPAPLTAATARLRLSCLSPRRRNRLGRRRMLDTCLDRRGGGYPASCG